jgi:uncharacterized protein DUF998
MRPIVGDLPQPCCGLRMFPWHNRPMRRLPPTRTLAAAGAIAPWLWSAIVIVLTFLEYDTLTGFGWTPLGSHGVNYPSSLALGRFGLAQMANFGLFGILMIGLAVALYRSVRPKWPARIAPVLMGISGFGFLMSVFPTDNGPPSAPMTWHGEIHGIGFIVMLIPFVLSMFFLALSFRGDSRWSGYVWLGPAVGVLALAAFIGLGALLPASLDQIAFYVTLLVLFVGLTLVGLRIRSIDVRGSA